MIERLARIAKGLKLNARAFIMVHERSLHKQKIKIFANALEIFTNTDVVRESADGDVLLFEGPAGTRVELRSQRAEANFVGVSKAFAKILIFCL
jgi:hypothetical protein